MKKSVEESFCELWADYLEGELDEVGLAELRKLMAEDSDLLELAADTFQTHRLLGIMTNDDSSDAFVLDTMRRLPNSNDSFSDDVMIQLRPKNSKSSTITVFSRILQYGGWAVASLLLVLVIHWVGVSEGSTKKISRARFASLAQASFFGELTPRIASQPELNRDYSLVSGSVELLFPDGASAIVEAPAVFRVMSDDRLALDFGKCSVHAPMGAEGFLVVTPNSLVIDRGTRFFVNVSESSETEVHVVEGAADIQPEGSSVMETIQLMGGNARTVKYGTTVLENFSPERYLSSLPDRVISYEAKPGEDGLAKTLTGVTVQRGGRKLRYSSESLIPIELTSFFVGPDTHRIGHLVCNTDLPERRATLLENFDFNSGIINPGGSMRPLSGPFDPMQTPGFAIHFREPVENGPGPDVVFFEIQNAARLPEGDAFHVSPLMWEDHLRSHTISHYDLMLTSSSALPVSERFLFQTKDPILSLENLEMAEATPSVSKLRFSALAVGIDLSDLGYAQNELVDGLFFQDAMNDDDNVDPMVIVGLPSE